MSCDGDIGLREIAALAKQRHTEAAGTGIGEAIAHIEPSRVVAAPEATESVDGDAADFGGDGNDLKRSFRDKLIDSILGNIDGSAADTSDAEYGFVQCDRRGVAIFGLIQARCKFGRLRLAYENCN